MNEKGSALLTKYGCEASDFHLRNCPCPHWQYQLKALPPSASTTVPCLRVRAKTWTRSEILSGLRRKRRKRFFKKKKQTREIPRAVPSTAPGSFVLGHLTGTANESQNKRQQELTQTRLPKAPYCWAAAAPRAPAANSWGRNPWSAPAACAGRAACPACAGTGRLGSPGEGPSVGQDCSPSGRGGAPLPDGSPVSRRPRHQIHELLRSPML